MQLVCLLLMKYSTLILKTLAVADKMLNFFVTLVNVISLPVIMVGTPKGKGIFSMIFVVTVGLLDSGLYYGNL